MYVRPTTGGHWATSVVWGRNVDLEFTQPPFFGDGFAALQSSKDNRRYHRVSFPTRIPRQVYNSYLTESTLRFRNRNWIWGRFENVDRDTYLLYEEEPFVRLVEEQRYARPSLYRWLRAGAANPKLVAYCRSRRTDHDLWRPGEPASDLRGTTARHAVFSEVSLALRGAIGLPCSQILPLALCAANYCRLPLSPDITHLWQYGLASK